MRALHSICLLRQKRRSRMRTVDYIDLARPLVSRGGSSAAQALTLSMKHMQNFEDMVCGESARAQYSGAASSSLTISR